MPASGHALALRPLRLAVVAVLVLSGAGDVSAQADPRRRTRAFQLTGVGGYAEVEVRSQREERKRKGSAVPWDFERLTITELLQLDTDSFVYHPRFLLVHTGLRFENLGERREGEDRFLMGGEGRLEFLHDHPYGFVLNGSMQEQASEQRFGRTFERRFSSYGGQVRFDQGPLPFVVSYLHGRQNGDTVSSDLKEVSDSFRYRARYQLGQRSRGDLEYEWLSRRAPTEDVRSHELAANHSTDLGAGGASRFDANLRMRQWNEPRRNDHASGSGRVRWAYAPNLTGIYRITASRDDTPLQTVNRWSPSAMLWHQLYESLRSTVQVYADLQNASFGVSRDYSGNLTEAYTKKLGGWGKLDINLGAQAGLTQERPERGEAQACEEIQINPGETVELSRLQAVLGSVEVYSGAACTTLVAANNYSLRQDVPHTWITSIFITGPVWVSYRYRLTDRSDILTSSFSQETSLQFLDHYRVYGRRSTLRQREVEGLGDVLLDSWRRHTAGVRGSFSNLTAEAEFEREKGDRRSYRSLRESILLRTGLVRIGGLGPWQAQLRADHRFTEYTDIDEEVDRTSVTGSLTHRVTRRGLLEMRAILRRERWDRPPGVLDNDLNHLELNTDFSWWYGRIRLKLEGRLIRVERQGQDETYDRITLTLRRDF